MMPGAWIRRDWTWLLALVVAFGLMGCTCPAWADEDEILRVVEVYKRTMRDWNVDYDTLTPNRAGAACIPWHRLGDTFLDEGRFDALGYGWQIADEPVAVRAAMEGCERMRRGNRLEGDCACELILYNDEVRLEPPEPGS